MSPSIMDGWIAVNDKHHDMGTCHVESPLGKRLVVRLDHPIVALPWSSVNVTENLR